MDTKCVGTVLDTICSRHQSGRRRERIHTRTQRDDLLPSPPLFQWCSVKCSAFSSLSLLLALMPPSLSLSFLSLFFRVLFLSLLPCAPSLSSSLCSFSLILFLFSPSLLFSISCFSLSPLAIFLSLRFTFVAQQGSLFLFYPLSPFFFFLSSLIAVIFLPLAIASSLLSLFLLFFILFQTERERERERFSPSSLPRPLLPLSNSIPLLFPE